MTPDPRLPTPDSPRCAVLTPAGRGAIATVAIRGPGALAAVSRRFRPAVGKSLEKFAVGRAIFGRFLITPTTAEELVVGRIAPQEVEIHCHGGSAVVAAICEALVAEGCVLLAPEEWIREQEPDPLAAQAMLALGQSPTERTAAILLDQFRGALRVAVSEIERLLLRNDIPAAKSALSQLLSRAQLGLHLTQPWKVVLAGAPNVGKSSLANSILGYQRSIVWQEPGTTRDVLSATTALDGWPIELSDTAGLRTASDALEAEGVARAKRQIAAADLVILVLDTTAAFDESLYAQIAHSRRQAIIAHNKSDLARPPADGRPAGIETSAKTGLGVDLLCSAIVQSLVPNPPPRSTAIPFTRAQVTALEEAAAQLASGNTAAARHRLSSVLNAQAS